jgi:sulfite reductase beta subunit-like hemoprotein
VSPGGEIYLRQSGWPKVERVLQAIDAVEQIGVDPVDACPDYWRHIHNRLASGETPRLYTRERHRAWLQRQRIDA